MTIIDLIEQEDDRLALEALLLLGAGHEASELCIMSYPSRPGEFVGYREVVVSKQFIEEGRMLWREVHEGHIERGRYQFL